MQPLLKFTVDDREFRFALRRLADATQRDIGDVVRQQARLIAVNLAYQTQPFGDAAGKAKGQNRVRRDIGHVYRGASYAFEDVEKSSGGSNAAREWWYLVKNNRMDQAVEVLQRLNLAGYSKDITIGVFDGGLRHQQARTGGRKQVSNRRKIDFVVTNQGALSQYLKKIQQRVGTAKGGWAACAKLIGGTRGIPGWVSRQTSRLATGSVVDNTRSTRNPFVSMTNGVPWIDKCLNDGQMQRAFDIQKEKMLSYIDRVIRSAGRRAGFRT